MGTAWLQSCVYPERYSRSSLLTLHCFSCTGSEIENGDLRAASSTLSGSWVSDFERATGLLDASETEAAAAQAILAGIGSLKTTTGTGDVKAAKKEFVTLVAAVQDWASSTGLSATLKGL